MKKFIVLLMMLCMMTACQTKDAYVSSFKSFVEEVNAKAGDYTEKDWEKADKKFSLYADKLYSHFEEELTPEEKAEILKLQASYSAIKVKSSVKKAADKVKDLFK